MDEEFPIEIKSPTYKTKTNLNKLQITIKSKSKNKNYLLGGHEVQAQLLRPFA